MIKRFLVVAFAGLVALAVIAPAALAEEKVVCRGTIGARTVDNLRACASRRTRRARSTAPGFRGP